MNPYQTLASAILHQAGLNCHAVFDVASLPPELRENLLEQCPDALRYKQLLLIGHGGTAMWQALQTQLKEQSTDVENDGNQDSHPIDQFSIATVQEFLKTEWSGCSYEIVYPGSRSIGLQSLGHYAGWHHPSPFMVGINAYFGSWFAYRVAVLADTNLPLSAVESAIESATEAQVKSASPCATCVGQVCVSACPAQALNDGQFNLEKCLDYRQQASSLCEKTCVARTACPVGSEHRYTDAQINYHYGRSIKMIRVWQQTK